MLQGDVVTECQSFGFLHKEKLGIISKLNTKGNGVNVFLDYLAARVAAVASARIAHRQTGD